MNPPIPSAASADRPATRLATRLAFLVAGFGVSCWAPLVPLARERLGVGESVLGLLLLCIGVGSVAAMLVTGVLSARWGSRPIILAGGIGLAVVLPWLVLAPTVPTLAVALLAFGAALGSLDVAMNVHAVEVERASKRPLMSGFHALFSVGGFAGAGAMTALLSAQIGPAAATVLCAVLMLAAMAVAAPRLLRSVKSGGGPLFAVPRGIVLLLAGLAGILFLVEGAILDWGALFVIDAGLAPAAQAGLGYVLFSVAMTAGRFGGDAVTARLGDRTTLLAGGGIALAGFALVMAAPGVAVAMAGFVLIGLGASNLVPILFRRAGTQRAMPAGLAVAAVTTTGYAGILVGPAAVGFVADAVGLRMAFGLLAALLCLVPISARLATAEPTAKA